MGGNGLVAPSHAPKPRPAQDRLQAAEGLPLPPPDVLDAPAHPLGVLEPGLGLVPRLAQDALATVPDRPWPRRAAWTSGALFLMLWLTSLRASALGDPWPAPGMPASLWMFLFSLSGFGTWTWMALTWRGRGLRLPLTSTQAEQLAVVRSDRLRLGRLAQAGLGALGAGTAVSAAAFLFLSPGSWGLPLTVGAALLVGGALALAAWAGGRRQARLLYVQTVALARLEAMGVGEGLCLDPRTADVLVLLDDLLGALPESSIRRFLSSPEAEWYLELLERIREAQHGG